MLCRHLITAAFALAVPAVASAQSFGVAARAGTLGFGGEAAYQISDNFAVRAGVGTYPFSITGELTDARYEITPPSSLLNAGVDFYPGWLDFRIGAGMLMIGDETQFDAQYTGGTVVIDGQEYTDEEAGTVRGELDHGAAAPYANIGLGRHTGGGIGIFADFGAAFLGEQNVTLTATGPAAQNAEFQDRLDAEREDIETEVRKYVKVLPIISVGIRFGF